MVDAARVSLCGHLLGGGWQYVASQVALCRPALVLAFQRRPHCAIFLGVIEGDIVMPISGKNSARLLVTGVLAAVLPFTLASPVVHAHTAPGNDTGAAEVVDEPQDIAHDEATDDDVEVMTMKASPEVWASLPRGGRGIMDERALINAVEDYWTPERIANATERTVPESALAQAAEETAAFDGRDLSEVADVSATRSRMITHPANPSVETEALWPMPKEKWATGKLFITDKDGNDAHCTASVVNSSSKRVIVTASHCIYDSVTKSYFRNITFMGGFKRIPRRNLTFVVDKYATTPEWRRHGKTAKGYWYDYSFASTHNNRKGHKVVDVLGAHGFGVGLSARNTHEVVLPAYPSNLQGGRVQRQCGETKTTGAWLDDGPGTKKYPIVRLYDCDFGKGASGGPWLYAFREDTGHGYVVGVTSNVDVETGKHVSSALFRKDAIRHFNRVNK